MAGAVVWLASCAETTDQVASSTTAGSVPAPTFQEQAIAKRIFKLVNDERVKVGRKPLRGNKSLNNMAQRHSHFQATSELTGGKPSHFGTKNRAQYAYLKYGIENMGEVVLVVPSSSSDPAASAVNSWKKSKEHRRHITETWELTGVGVYKAKNGKTYLTMLVGVRPGGVPRSMQPRAWH